MLAAQRRTTSGPRRAAAGFTLYELVMVVALSGIVAAMAVPRYVGSMARYRAQSAARRVVADLALARAKARASSSPQSVTFSPAAGSYTVSGVRDLDRRGGVYTVNLSRSPYNVSIDYADFGGAPQAQFNMYGEPAWGGTVVVRAGDFGCTVTLAKSDGSVTVQ